MKKYPQRQKMQTTEQKRRWLVVAAVLLIATGLAFGYGYREHSRADQLASQATRMSATINQLQSQINRLNSKLNESISALAPVPVRRPSEEWLSGHPRLRDSLWRQLQRKEFGGAIVVQSQ